MKDLIRIFVILLIFTAISYGQWSSKKVLWTETATSDSFHCPGANQYFSGIFFKDTLHTWIGNSTRNKVYFWVSNDPVKQGWQKLSYDGAAYYVDITSLAITLKPQATYSWEYFKCYLGAAVKDSVYFYPQFNDMDH
jgi:hypothetical protein